MIIISIKKKGSDIEICFDDGSKITLDYRVVFDNGLRKRDVINESQINNFLYQSEKQKTKDSAFRYLSRRLHSSQELKTKLFKKGYRKEIIEELLNEFIKKNLLNDSDFAQTYLDEKISRKKVGINKIKAGLIQKGIERKIIEGLTDYIDPNLSRKNAFELAKKKLALLKERESRKSKLKQKLFSYLMMKGFESDIIKSVINDLISSDIEEDLAG